MDPYEKRLMIVVGVAVALSTGVLARPPQRFDIFDEPHTLKASSRLLWSNPHCL